MRRWIGRLSATRVLALAAIAVLALAVPAQAKGEATAVTITNPGDHAPGVGGGSGGGGSGIGGDGGTDSGGAATVLSAPIHIAGPSVTTWLEDTGALQGVRQHHPPANELGPALEVSLRYSCGPGHSTISQRLFPYAKGGPMIQTPPGQAFCDSMQLAPVWWHLDSATVGMLRAHGLPAARPAKTRAAGPGGAARAQSAASAGTRPVTDAESATHEAPGTRTPAVGSSAGLPVSLAIGTLVVAALLMLAVVQRRRRAVAA